MIVEKILKELTPERIKKEIEMVKRVKFSPELQKWIQGYEKVGRREGFTWKLLLNKSSKVNYISAPKIYKESFLEVKFLIAMFIILLDDVADVSQNKKLLNELLKIPFRKAHIKSDKLNKKEKAYLNFTLKVWRRIEKIIRKYPGYGKLKEVFEYDVNQIMNAIEYDHLVHDNRYLINKTEFWLYPPQTMQCITGVSIDLMLSRSHSELSVIRKVAWESNKMARMGNWISTWEEEIKNNDFSSGVFAIAVDSNILTAEELTKNNAREIIGKIKKSKIENILLKEWEDSYQRIFKLREKIKTINVPKLLSGLEELLIIEISRKKT